jgi:hypothetical protein
MQFRRLVLSAALTFGLGGAVCAAPVADCASNLSLPSGAVVQFAKWKEKHAWKGNRGRHLGWHRGRHLGWYKKGRHRGVY